MVSPRFEGKAGKEVGEVGLTKEMTTIQEKEGGAETA